MIVLSWWLTTLAWFLHRLGVVFCVEWKLPFLVITTTAMGLRRSGFWCSEISSTEIIAAAATATTAAACQEVRDFLFGLFQDSHQIGSDFVILRRIENFSSLYPLISICHRNNVENINTYLFWVEEWGGFANISDTTSSTNTMHIVINAFRNIVVDHVAYTGNICIGL